MTSTTATGHATEPWSHHYAQGKSFVLSKAHDAGLFTGDVIATEGTDQNALANHARIVACVNACAGIKDPAALVKALKFCLQAMRTAGLHTVPGGLCAQAAAEAASVLGD